MSTVSEPADAGKVTDPSTPAPSADPLTQVLSAIRGLKTRIDILERRFEYLERDVLRAIGSGETPPDEEDLAAGANDVEPLTEPGAGPLAAPLALLSDGRIALSTIDLEGVDLSEREVFTGIVLEHDETSDVLDYMAGGIADAAARVVGDLLQRHPAKKDGGGESGNGEGGAP